MHIYNTHNRILLNQRKYEIMSFAITLMNLDYHIKWNKSDREKQIYNVTYMWNPKNDADEFIYKTEIDFQYRKKTWGEEDKLGVWDQQIHTTTYKTDKWQGPTI